MMLAVMQAACHLGFDYDRISFPVDKTAAKQESKEDLSTEKKLSPNTQSRNKLREKFIPTLRNAIIQSAAVAIISPILYALFIRNRAWEVSMFFARLLWDVAPVAELSYVPPYHITVILRSFIASAILLYLWQISIEALSAFFAQEPVKNDQPLSAGSSDPNGSLLDGLKSKKEINKVGPLPFGRSS